MIADNSESRERFDDDGFSMWEIGLNVRKPIDFRVRNRETHLNLFFVYTAFLNKVEFNQELGRGTTIPRLYKLGVALSGREAFSFWRFGLSGVGIEYIFGPDFTGIGVTTGFPF
jgi:hypothetical protein